jgi:hypothetical protein
MNQTNKKKSMAHPSVCRVLSFLTANGDSIHEILIEVNHTHTDKIITVQNIKQNSFKWKISLASNIQSENRIHSYL